MCKTFPELLWTASVLKCSPRHLACFLLPASAWCRVTSMKTFLSYKTQRRVAPGSSLASVLVLWKSPWGNAIICQANNLDYGARPCGCWPGGQKHASFLTTELINHQPIRRLHPLLSVLLPPAPTRPTHHLAVAKSLNSFSIILLSLMLIKYV